MGKLLSQSFIPIMLALAAAGILILGGLNANKTLVEKATAQADAVTSLLTWRESYLALKPTEDEWRKAFVAHEDVPDIRSLLGVVNLQAAGLTGDIDTVVVSKVEPQVFGPTAPTVGMNVAKVYLAMANGGTFIVKAPTYNALLEGLKILAARRDLYIGNIEIKGDGKQPQAALGGFFVYVRTM